MSSLLNLRRLMIAGFVLSVLAACNGSPAAPGISRVTPLPATDAASVIANVETVGVTSAEPTQIAQLPATALAVPTETLSAFGLFALTNAANPTTATPRAPTPTPLSTQLASGQAAAIAAATDTAYVPTVESRLTFEQQPVPMTFDEFYDGYNLRTGLILSQKLLSLDGQQVVMEGYMAPPLKPELDYFVLTRVRLAFCPFCTTGADWPDDIALIYLNSGTVAVTMNPVRVTGRMEVGISVDHETGMVSLVRIYVDALEELTDLG